MPDWFQSQMQKAFLEKNRYQMNYLINAGFFIGRSTAN